MWNVAMTELSNGTRVSTIPWGGGYETAILTEEWHPSQGEPEGMRWHKTLDEALRWHAEKMIEEGQK